MAIPTTDQLWKEALSAHQRGDFDAEVVLRRQLCDLYPTDMNCLHNLGLALFKQGRIDDAVVVFEQVIKTDPTVGRAHNNLACALIQSGVDLQRLVPVLHTALLLSESNEDLIRHFVNLCMSASLGCDRGNREVLDEIAITIREVVDHCSGEVEIKDKQLSQLLQVLDAHRPLADYREALAAKRWAEAEESLYKARCAFESLGFSHRLTFIDVRLKPILEVCKDLFAFLERIATGKFGSPKDALLACEQCRNEAMRIRESFGNAGIHLQFFDALGWFLTKLLRTLKALSESGQIEPEDAVPADIIGFLTAESFTGIGADLLSLLNAVERQCRNLREELVSVADEGASDVTRQTVWMRLALQCHSLTFDFRKVSGELARSVLGWNTDTRGQFIKTLEGFRRFVERQAASDILNNGKPNESIGRSLLQAYLTSRTYREVPIRGGKCDILAFATDGKRLVLETKIWRGTEYYEQGLREIGEYLEGECTDEGYLGTFFVIFDPTKHCRAAAHLGSHLSTQSIGRFAIDVLVISITLPVPSKKP